MKKIKLSEMVNKLLREFEEDDPKHFAHDDDFPMEKGGDDRPEKKPETPGTPENGVSKNSEASEEAHKLGLIAKPYGNWADKTGKTVAKTISGKLVKIEDPEAEAGKDQHFSNRPQKQGQANAQYRSQPHVNGNDGGLEMMAAMNNDFKKPAPEYSYEKGSGGKLSDELKKYVKQNADKIKTLDKLFTGEGGASKAVQALGPEQAARWSGAIRTMTKVARHDYENAEMTGNQVNPDLADTPGYDAIAGMIELYDAIPAGDVWDQHVDPHQGKIPRGGPDDGYDNAFETSVETNALAYDLFRSSSGMVRQGQDPFGDPKNKQLFDAFVESVKNDVKKTNPYAKFDSDPSGRADAHADDKYEARRDMERGF
jgi:hypothetical protein